MAIFDDESEPGKWNKYIKMNYEFFGQEATLDVHDKNPKEISSLVELFVDTDERPLQIITDYEFYSKRKEVVKEILNRKRKQGDMQYYCLFNTPYVTWRIYK